ncbi:Rv2231c family pyridoxal phosphate-dependent protein CobC [Williamsia maris]|uniref:Aminotransferase n=1 Tax=Williamsia maris TaxID=72806 RepID=A0ABT1HFM1_9NOCA|nr:Rv2231c family pyridoxal phosphate-dependent protein CobC [Williamsia maris]MCP2177042.1 histidinol-phosphate aminotransferase [Williamsia maris]
MTFGVVRPDETDADLTALDRHGDVDATAGMVDFAVNVRGETPAWLRDELRHRVDDVARYPSRADELAATTAVAEAHGRPASEILLLAGAAEGFALLPNLRPRRVALVQPSFTEPERVLRSAGIDIDQVVVSEPWGLDTAEIDDAVDMVVLGNPTNPTSVLHPRSAVEALRRPGRIIVVDEAFADVTVGEPESLASSRFDDVIVIRSITKTFALAGLRAGYLLAAAPVVARLAATRPHWALGTLQLAALEMCLGERGHAHAYREAQTVTADRDAMVAALTEAGIEVCGTPAASFVVVRVADGTSVKEHLAQRGVAVRSCANFVGMTPDHLRLAVRDPATVRRLLDAWKDVI